MSKYNRLTRLMISCATVGCIPLAHAQTVAPAPAAAQPDTGEIIVTAQRRSENVLKVPVSLTVVGAEALQRQGISNLAQLTALAPSLQASQNDSFSIRGVGTTTFSPTLEPTVSEVVDDVVLGNAAFAAGAFYDVARVEVLNGPQGLLFGKNASAGLVNITTTRPQLNVTGGDITAELDDRYRPGGDGHGVELRANLNLAVGTKSAVRVSGIYEGQDSIIRYVAPVLAGRNDPNLKQGGGRIKFLSEPIDGLTIYLIGDYYKSSGAAAYNDSTIRQFGPGSNTAAEVAAAGISYGVVPGPRNLEVASDYGSYRDVEMGGVSANIAYKFESGVELNSITAYKGLVQNINNASSQVYFNGLDINSLYTNHKQFTQEFRLALPSENRLTGQFGLYYYHVDIHNTGLRLGMNGFSPAFAAIFPFCVNGTLGPPPYNFGGQNCPYVKSTFLGQDNDITQHNNSSAAFGQLTYKVTSNFRLTAGGRFTHDETDIALTQDVGASQYFQALSGPFFQTTDRATANNFSFKVGPEWQITPTTMLYGFYGQGYKGPGFSNVAVTGANLAVSPEISKGGEIGIKGTALDRLVTYSASVFYTRFTNLQVQAWDAVLQTDVLQNAAVATSKGVDLNVGLHPAKGLTFSGNASFLSAKYNSYSGTSCWPTEPTGSGPGQCNLTFGVPGAFSNESGTPTLLSSKFTTDIGGEYAYPLSSNLSAILGVDVYHRSSFASGFSPGEQVPQVTRFNANLGLHGGAWSLTVFCKNCFNAIRPLSISQYPGDANGTPPALSYSQTFNNDSIRTVGLRAGYKF